MATDHNFRVKNGLEVGTGTIVTDGTNVTLSRDGSTSNRLRITNGTVHTDTDLSVTGDLAVSGNFNITGDINQTSVTTLDVTDLTITVANNAGSASNANNAGLIVDTGGSNPSLLYKSTGDKFSFNKTLEVNSRIETNTLNNVGNTANIIYRSSTNTIVGNNASALVVQDGGNVGIGESIPTEKLHVGGNIKMQASTAIVTYQNAVNTWNVGLDAADASFKFKDGTDERIRIDSSGNLLVGTTSSVSTSSSQTGAEMRANGIVVGAVNGNVSFIGNRIGSDGDIALFRRDGTTVGSIGTAGGQLNIGLNTTSGLNFGSSIIYPRGTGNTTQNGTIDLGNSGNRFKDLYLSNKVYAAYIGASSDTDTSINFDTANTIKMFTGGTERMRIDSSGNVIVGGGNDTGFATTKLKTGSYSTAESGINILTTPTGTGYLLFGDGTGAASYSGGIHYNHNTSHMSFRTLANYERMRIDSSGKVGIGTSSPGKLLTLSRSAEAQSEQLEFRTEAGGISDGNYDGIVWTYGTNGGTTLAEQRVNYYTTGVVDMSFNLRNEDNVLYLKAGGNVGIGTSSPNEKLEVAGSIRLANLKIQNVSSGRLGFNRNTANGVIYDSSVSAFQINGPFSGSDYLDFQSYSSAGAYYSSMVIKAGNVGIGTTAPMTKLHVFDSDGSYPDDVNNHLVVESSSHSYIGIGGGTSSDVGIHFGDNGGISRGRLAYLNGSDAMAFSTNAVERMRIDNQGAVGIGVVPPTTNVHPQLFIGSESVILGATSGALDIGNNLYYNSGWKHRSTGAGSLLDFDASGNIVFYRAASASANSAATLQISAKIDSSGNVGIGQSTINTFYDTALGMYGAGHSVIQFQTSNTGTASGDGFAVGVLNGAATDAYLWNRESSNLLFGTGGGEKMRIDASGNVGIGTTAPANKLHVKAGASGATTFDSRYNLTLEDNGENYLGIYAPNNSFSGVRFVNADNSIRGHIDYYLGTQGDKFVMYSQNGWDFQYPSVGLQQQFKPNGNVNLGATHAGFSGWRVLNIRQSSTGGMVNFDEDDGTRAFTFANQGVGMRYQAHITGGYHRWETHAMGGGTAMMITDAGNVGIGTSSPAEKLEVNGALRLGQSSSLGTAQLTHHTNNFMYMRGGSAGAIISDDSGINTLRVADGSSGYVMVETGDGTERMRIDSAGRLSLGPDASDILIDPASTNSNNNLIYMRGNASGDKSSIQMNHYGSADYHIGVGHVAAGKFNIANNLTGDDFVIDTSGNVGIGTSSPSAGVPLTVFYSSTSQFHIGGAQAGISNNVYYNGSAYTNRNTSVGGALLQIATDGSFAFRRATSGSSPTLNYSMYIDSLGKVGIGTTAPTQKLEIVESSNYKGIHIRGSNAPSLTFGKNATTTQEWKVGISGVNGNNFAISTGTGSGEKLVVDTSGNVGIGTTSPLAKLHLDSSEFFMKGGTTTTGPGIFLGDANFANTNYYNSAPGIGSVGPYGGVTAGLALYYYNGQQNARAEAMRIDNSGNVGIGTTSPGTKVHVVGTLTGTTALFGGSQIMASSAALQVNGFQRTGTIYLHEGNTAVAGNNWPITTTSGGELQWDGNKVWTSGNDSSGSGLDADLLDGQHGSHYLNYNNLTNKPSIPPQSATPTVSVGANGGDVTITNYSSYINPVIVGTVGGVASVWNEISAGVFNSSSGSTGSTTFKAREAGLSESNASSAVNITLTTRHRYWRLTNFTGGTSQASSGNFIRHINFYSDAAGTIKSANYSTRTASYFYSTTYEPSKTQYADGNGWWSLSNATANRSGTGTWLKLDNGAVPTVAAVCIRLDCNTTYMATACDLQFSDDNSNWTTWMNISGSDISDNNVVINL